jgi:hypothetical protein
MVSGTHGPLLQLFTILSWYLVIIIADKRPFMSNGGWHTYPSDLLVQPGPCNVDIRDRTLSQEEFLEKYAYTRPVVIRDSADNDLFRALTER